VLAVLCTASVVLAAAVAFAAAVGFNTVAVVLSAHFFLTHATRCGSLRLVQSKAVLTKLQRCDLLAVSCTAVVAFIAADVFNTVADVFNTVADVVLSIVAVVLGAVVRKHCGSYKNQNLLNFIAF
jgi:hypothetical protein